MRKRGIFMLHKEITDKLMPINDEEKTILNGGGINENLYNVPGSSVIESRLLLSRGKLITVRPHTRFVHFPCHTHDYVEAIYMCMGKTTHYINGNEVILKSGELLFLSQNAEQEILPAGTEDLAVNFIILPEFFDTAVMMMGDEETPLRKFLVDCMKNNSENAGYLHFKVSDIVPVQNLIENLLWSLLHKNTNRRRIIQNTMGLLFLHLMDYTERLEYGDNRDEAIIKALSYIENNYASASLTELAQRQHYDFAWYSREIKKKTGSTFTELVQQKRLSQAAFMLKNTDINIADIAIKTGYDNISYFHRIFKEKFGLTPHEYRVQIRTQNQSNQVL